MRKYRFFVGLMLLVLSLVIVATPVLAGSVWIKTRIGLRATENEPLASGKAVYREKDFGFRRKFSVFVEDIVSTTDVEVFVDGTSVGIIPLVLGEGELELDTRDDDTVPLIVPGSRVKVRNADTGELLLRGRNN